MEARSVDVPAGMTMLGETFQPGPSSLAAVAPVPVEARPPPPCSPVGFSAVIDLVRPCEPVLISQSPDNTVLLSV